MNCIDTECRDVKYQDPISMSGEKNPVPVRTFDGNSAFRWKSNQNKALLFCEQ